MIQSSEFAFWLSSVPVDRFLCETLEFWIPESGVGMNFANKIAKPTIFTTAWGDELECQPAAFSVGLPLIEGNGTVELTVNFDSVEFTLFDYFDNLKGLDLNVSVELYYGAYLLPGGESNPLLSTYPVFYVAGASLSYKSTTINAATRRLPNRKLGSSYNVTDFPGLDIDY